MIHPDFEFNEAKDCFICRHCGSEVLRGLISMSFHWADCGGKATMQNIKKKIDKMPLAISDKMELVKKVFNIEQ